MNDKAKEGINHIKESVKICSDIGLMLDDGLITESVYDIKNVEDVLLLFSHVTGNYIAGEMIKQGCKNSYMEKNMEEFGSSLRDLMIEYTKKDPRTFYSK